MFDTDKARDWLLEYMKKTGYSSEKIAAVKRAPKTYFPNTAGWIARILMNGNQLPNLEYIESRIDYLADLGSKSDDVTQPDDKPVVNIQERTRAKNNQVISDIEYQIDHNFLTFEVYDYLKANEITPTAAAAVREYYVKIRDEVCDGSEEVAELYGKKLKEHIKFWNGFIDDCDRFIGNVKASKVRKPREKKMKSAIDLVKDLKYKKDFPELKLSSVNPAEIVGASQVWLYNVKYKKLTKLNATSTSGFNVKGTTIDGVDIENSTSKTLRKPDVALKELLVAGKVTLRKFMDGIKAVDSPVTGRCNEDTVIVRVVKG